MRARHARRRTWRRVGRSNVGFFGEFRPSFDPNPFGTSIAVGSSVGKVSKGVARSDGGCFVTLRALVELTALISAHSPNLIESARPLPVDALQRFWSCSRAQGRLWTARLVDFPAELATTSPERCRELWLRTLPLFADILAGNLVTRVWGAVLSAADIASGNMCGEPIARSALLQHATARNRALRIMSRCSEATEADVAPVDQLRRRLERWTDVLLGHLVHRYGLEEYAFDAERARDFGEEQIQDSWKPADVHVWDLYLVCLRTSLPDVDLPGGRLADLRDEIARTMLSTFPQEAFLDTGPLKSVRTRRFVAGFDRPETRPVGFRRRIPRRS